MILRPIVVVSAVGLVAVACGTQEGAPAASGTWLGTITTEGDVTTVVNEAGSVWGGTAMLVEEASIGVEAGSEEFTFGRVSSVFASANRIYVVDGQVPAVRAYDYNGRFLDTLGGRGQGPGEYTDPALVVADTSGRVYAIGSQSRRVNVYAEAGEAVHSWTVADSYCCFWDIWPAEDDGLWLPVFRFRDDGPGLRYGARAHGPFGPLGETRWVPEIEFEAATFEATGFIEQTAPYSPLLVWNTMPRMALAMGANDVYRFEILRSDGSRRIIERAWEPEPLPPGHREWARQRTVARIQRRTPGWQWDGAEIPDHLPAFSMLLGAGSGETWVARYTQSEEVADCAGDPLEVGLAAASANPCWMPRYVFDVFGTDGRYLGEVEPPTGLSMAPPAIFINDRILIGVTEDAAGTIMVKRYRLVLPGEE